MEPTKILTIKVNGEVRTVDVRPDTPLLWVLRDTLGLRGTNYSCCSGTCGTCSVYLDNQIIQSCIWSVAAVGERNILTVEGLRALREAAERERQAAEEAEEEYQ